MNAFHGSEINHDAAIAQTKARHVMTGTQNRGRNLVLTCELYRRDYVGNADTACDESGMPVNHCIVDLAGFLIVLVAGTKHMPPQRSLEILNY
jgi:hypothetical protein